MTIWTLAEGRNRTPNPVIVVNAGAGTDRWPFAHAPLSAICERKIPCRWIAPFVQPACCAATALSLGLRAGSGLAQDLTATSFSADFAAMDHLTSVAAKGNGKAAVLTILVQPDMAASWWTAIFAAFSTTSALGLLQGLLISRVRLPFFSSRRPGFWGFRA